MSLIRLPAPLHGAFRVVAGGGTLFLLYTSLVYLLEPQPDEAARLYDFAVLIGFEFILNPLNLMLLMFSHSIVGKVGVLAFFAGFVISFGLLMIDAQAMVLLIAAVLAGHFLPFLRVSEAAAAQATGQVALRIMWYFFALMGCVVASEALPTMGLDEAWLQASRYDQVRRHGGLLLEQPHVAVWIGVLYYGGLFLGSALALAFSFPPLQRRMARLGPWTEATAARMEAARLQRERSR